jgi:RNA polymerase sigma-70 factor, ECF subfamily
METTAVVTTDWAGERELVAALRRGEEGAFEALVEEYGALMLRVASTYVRSRAIAQDIVQDTWVSVLRSIDSFEGRSSLKTWIFRILVNRAKTRGAREGRSVPFSALSPDDSPTPEHLLDRSPWAGGAEGRPLHPEQRAIARETVGEAIRAIDGLPAAQRQVIAMRDLHGCSSDEVCSVLGISSGNQRVVLHRARAKVKRELERCFTAPALQA